MTHTVHTYPAMNGDHELDREERICLYSNPLRTHLMMSEMGTCVCDGREICACMHEQLYAMERNVIR